MLSFSVGGCTETIPPAVQGSVADENLRWYGNYTFQSVSRGAPQIQASPMRPLEKCRP